MAKVSVTKSVDLPSQKVWDYWADFGNIYKFHPFVQKSYLAPQSKADKGNGCQRVCEMYNGMAVREEVTQYQEGKSMRVQIVESGKMPIKNFYVDILVKKEGNKTRVIMDGEFKAKGIGVLMTPMMKMQFKGMFNKLIDALEVHGQTGRVIGKGGVLQAATA